MNPNDAEAELARQGITLRPIQDSADQHVLVDLLNLYYQANQLDSVATVEQVAKVYACNAPHVALAIHDTAIIGVCRWQHWPLRDGTQVYSHVFYVHPQWQDSFLPQSLLQLNEQRLRALAAQEPEAVSSDQKRVLGYSALVDAAQVDLDRLLNEAGYRPIRSYYDMLYHSAAPPPLASLPADVKVRAVSPDDYPAIYAAHKEAFAEHFGSTPSSETDYQHWLTLYLPSTYWHVAWQGPEVVGMVLSSVPESENRQSGRQRGFCEAVSVRPDWRGQGIARALLCTSLALLHALGLTEVGLRVDTENKQQALQLYANVGFQVIKCRQLYEKPFEEFAPL